MRSEVGGTASRGVNRRGFLKLISAAGLSGLAAVGASAYASEVEPNNILVEHITIQLSRLPSAFEGIRIALLSDLHLGPDVRAAHIERTVELTNAQRPDVIAIAGDLVSSSWLNMQPCVQILSRLDAPLGVFVVYGNHDYWVGFIPQTMEIVHRAGLTLLRNQSVPLTRGKSQLYLLGIDDWWLRYANLQRALSGVPRNACKVALMHEPDYADYAAEAEVDLQLSGHSHGGQVRIPGIGALILPRYGRKYPMGLARVGNFTQVYTTRGIGVLPPAVRFNCPPEITIVQLTSGPA